MVVRSSEIAEDVLRERLKAEGYLLTARRGHGETGVDIFAKKGEVVYAIDVIGYKEQGPARAKDFFEGFFRTISRIDQHPGATPVLALPREFAVGARARRSNHGSGWDRIGQAFPEFEIWYVDCEARAYRSIKWNDFGLCNPWHEAI